MAMILLSALFSAGALVAHEDATKVLGWCLGGLCLLIALREEDMKNRVDGDE